MTKPTLGNPQNTIEILQKYSDVGTLGSDALCKLLLRQSFFQSCLRQLLHDALPCRQQFLFGHTKPSLLIHYNVIIYDNDCQEVRLSFQVPRFLFGRFFTLIGFTADDLVLTLKDKSGDSLFRIS